MGWGGERGVWVEAAGVVLVVGCPGCLFLGGTSFMSWAHCWVLRQHASGWALAGGRHALVVVVWLVGLVV